MGGVEMEPIEYHVTEQSPGVYAVVFRLPEGVATFVVPYDSGRSEEEKKRNDVGGRSEAGRRARNIAAAFVRHWDGE
jgi:hypothetical protein